MLRTLVGSHDGNAQVMHATHSPSFIGQCEYQGVHRLSRGFSEGHPATVAGRVTEDSLIEALEPFSVRADAIRRRTGMHCFEHLAEAFFADVAVLVEGTTDLAVINACAERQGLRLGSENIVCAAVHGRDNMSCAMRY